MIYFPETDNIIWHGFCYGCKCRIITQCTITLTLCINVSCWCGKPVSCVLNHSATSILLHCLMLTARLFPPTSKMAPFSPGSTHTLSILSVTPLVKLKIVHLVDSHVLLLHRHLALQWSRSFPSCKPFQKRIMIICNVRLLLSTSRDWWSTEMPTVSGNFSVPSEHFYVLITTVLVWLCVIVQHSRQTWRLSIWATYVDFLDWPTVLFCSCNTVVRIPYRPSVSPTPTHHPPPPLYPHLPPSLPFSVEK
jgi:hypothetical protein